MTTNSPLASSTQTLDSAAPLPGATGVSTAPVEPALSTTTADPSEATPGTDTENQPPTDRRQSSEPPASGVDKRKNVVDRRAGLERRVLDIGSPTGLERRRGPGRRRTDDRKSAEEGEMTDEQFEFIMAVDTYKRLNNRPFPSWTEVLEVVKQLGYRKVAASTIKLPNPNGRAQ